MEAARLAELEIAIGRAVSVLTTHEIDEPDLCMELYQRHGVAIHEIAYVLPEAKRRIRNNRKKRLIGVAILVASVAILIGVVIIISAKLS